MALFALPRAFGSRLALVFVLLFVVATASAALLLRTHRGATVEQAASALMVGQIRLVQALADGDANSMERLQGALARQNTRLLTGGEVPGPQRLSTPLLQRLQSSMSTALGTPVHLSLRALPPRELLVSFDQHGTPMALVLPLADWEPSLPAPALGWLLLLFGVTPLTAVLAFMLLQKPLRGVVHHIAEQGGRPARVAVPARADEDVVRLVRAYNGMVDQLAARDREREQMLAGVSHDIRAPLSRLRMRASLSDDAELADGIVRDVESLDRIAQQFIDFAQAGDGSGGEPGVCGDPAMVVRDAVAARPDHAAIELRLPDTAPPVQGDAATVERMLANLLDNAREYGRPPCIVTLTVEMYSVKLQVSDGGDGLGADALRRACQPFVRLDPARGGNGHCGLGLAIVSGLAARCGGQVMGGRDPEGLFAIGVTLKRVCVFESNVT